MSTETFLRLPEEKRNRFLDAAWEEFTRVRYTDVSINKIILKARIPRGSFYQYFRDKEDLFGYLLGSTRDQVAALFGALLQEAEGDLFRSVRYNGAESVDKSDAACLEMPMAVLVNGYSYSCAEFFAAALEEYDWAEVVGEPTVGKAYYQNTFRLLDGSAVGLSVGQYYTPNGVSLAEEGGLVPDVVVEVDDITFAMIYAKVLPFEEDPQLAAALDTLK